MSIVYLWRVSSITQRLFDRYPTKWLALAGLVVLFGLSGLLWVLTEEWVTMLLPFGALVLIWGMQDFRRLYFLMWATIPFAVEVDLPGGLSTDFPVELLMWLCCLMTPVYLYLYHRQIDIRFIYHPIFILLVIHFVWIVFTSIISTEPINSIKFTIAKSWYLVCFVLLPLLLFRNAKDFRTWGTYFLIPLVASIVIIMIRHSKLGFTFSSINNAVIPIYRNHVDYACTLGIVLPYIWILRSWFKGLGGKVLFWGSVAIILAGIYFSYTRAAWLCVPLAFGLFFVFRFRLMRVLVPIALACLALVIAWMVHDNRYLDFSPDYEKTITHNKFDDLISATYKLEDISTVERIYRWVAGFYMVGEKPLAGFGPSSFYNRYHNYADRHFITYVSDNPEHSGIHNYYLMVAVEQGIIGLLIFLALIIGVLLFGERLYHSMEPGVERNILLAALISFGCNLFILTLNDIVETDKLGSFFFMSIAIVVLFHLRSVAGRTSDSDYFRDK